MNICTYHSKNAKPEMAWVAYVINDGGMPVAIRFMGASEGAVIAEAQAFIRGERPVKPWERETTPKAYEAYKAEKPSISTERVGDAYLTTVTVPAPKQPGIGRGQGFVGKVWMLNRKTGERARVDVAEQISYEDMGFVKAGPRSK